MMIYIVVCILLYTMIHDDMMIISYDDYMMIHDDTMIQRPSFARRADKEGEGDR
jgi:hypothetical protein